MSSELKRLQDRKEVEKLSLTIERQDAIIAGLKTKLEALEVK